MEKPKRIRRNTTEDDPIVAVGTAKETVPASVLEPNPILRGSEVKVARIIKTPIGIRFRVANTIRWLTEEELEVKFDPSLIIDYSTHMGKNPLQDPKPSKQKEKKGTKQIQKSNQLKSGIRGATIGSTPNKIKGRAFAMDKKELKEVITSLNTGDKITVTFLDDLADRTGEYEVMGTKKGRGKGGSLLLVLKSGTGSEITTGTPDSNSILHVITPDGKLHGFENANEVPRIFETNTEKFKELNKKFLGLVGTSGRTVHVESTETEYTGDYTVLEAAKLRGRYGQIRLSLQAEDGTTHELWSYRHSGIITAFTVEGEETDEDTMTDEKTV